MEFKFREGQPVRRAIDRAGNDWGFKENGSIDRAIGETGETTIGISIGRARGERSTVRDRSPGGRRKEVSGLIGNLGTIEWIAVEQYFSPGYLEADEEDTSVIEHDRRVPMIVRRADTSDRSIVQMWNVADMIYIELSDIPVESSDD